MGWIHILFLLMSCLAVESAWGLRFRSRRFKLCHSVQCFNGGTCKVVHGKVKCHCPPAFTGLRCLKPTCDPNPCQYGGTCSIHGKKIRCQCTKGYKGRFCEKRNLCVPNPCLNNGTCTCKGNSFRCSCPPGFTGDRCQLTPCILPHGKSPCQNGGTCVVKGNNYWCFCPSPYTGRNCTLQKCDDCRCDQECTLEHKKPKCVPWCKTELFKKEGCPSGPGKVTCKNFCESDKKSGYFACVFDIDACKVGTLTSRNFPHPYSANKWDIYVLKVNSGSKITFTFKFFSVEKTAHCKADVVAIYDGVFNPFDSSNLVAKLCGNLTTQTFKSTGDVLTVKFKTDRDKELQGFKAVYEQDSCDPNPCKNGGTCENSKLQCDYNCTCPEGYEGKNCEIPKPPTISVDNANLIDGETATFTCNSILTGDSYEWFENGVKVAETNTNQYTTGPNGISDNGDVYTCKYVVNGVTSPESTNKITLKVSPKAPTVVPKKVKVIDGDEITYTCKTIYTAAEQVQFEWFKNGNLIPGADQQQYTFTSTLANNNDKFTCRVRTTPGGPSAQSDPVTPKVRPQAPSVIPENVKVTDGDEITYVCKTIYTAADQVQFEWFKNGVLIAGANQQQYTFTSTLANNNDKFTCRVRTTPGGFSGPSDFVTPKVKPQAPSVTPEDVTVTDGDPITYTCNTIYTAAVQVQFEWFKNGNPIPGADEQQYTFNSVLANNNDKFTCRVTTTPGGPSEQSEPVTPKVIPQAPFITPKDVTVTDGDQITYTCNTNLSAVDEVQYEWFKNGVLIPGANEQQYTFNSVLANNEDKFTCRVITKPGGPSPQSDPVTPKVIPQTPFITPEDVTVTDGDQITYTCNTNLSAVDEVRYEWFKNGVLIPEVDQQQYTFNSVLANNEDKFTCRVITKPGGPSPQSDPVTPKVTPQAPFITPKDVTVTDGDSITYTCNTNLSAVDEVLYEWFKNGLLIPNANQQQYTFNSVLANNEDKFTCRVITKPGGPSPQSDPVTPKVIPQAPFITPEDVTVIDGDQITYTCNTNLSAVDEVKYEWFKNGVLIAGANQQQYTFNSVLANNKDKFTCRVITKPGGPSPQSDSVTPKVRPQKPSVSPQNAQKTHGESLTYTCVTPYTDAQVDFFEWFINDTVKSQESGRQFTITAVLSSNFNEYSCRVTTFLGGSSDKADPVSPTVRCPKKHFGHNCEFNTHSCVNRCFKFHPEAHCTCTKNCYNHVYGDCCSDFKKQCQKKHR